MYIYIYIYAAYVYRIRIRMPLDNQMQECRRAKGMWRTPPTAAEI